MTLFVRFFLLAFVFCAVLRAEPRADIPDAIVRSYAAASRNQQDALRGASMEVEISASLPKLRKNGRLHALRRISRLGRITYEALRFEGDNTIKSNVIARYLTADVQSQAIGSPSTSVTPVNYKFKYNGVRDEGDRRIYVFQVSPRKKRQGLFKGELWIDAETYLPVRESGRLVKSPSIFLRRVEFVRTYDIRDGISIPRTIQSVVDTRLVGKAELNVDFSRVLLEEGPRASALDVGGSQ